VAAVLIGAAVISARASSAAAVKTPV